MFGRTPAEISDGYLQFAALARAGFGLEAILDCYQHAGPRAQKRRARRVIRELRRGATLDGAMRSAGLPSFDVAFMQAAGDTGRLDEAADRLAEHYLQQHTTLHHLKLECLKPGLLFICALFIAPVPKLANGFMSGEDYLIQALVPLFLVGFVVYLGSRLNRLAGRSRIAGWIRYRFLGYVPIAGRILRATAEESFFTCMKFYVSTGHTFEKALEACARVSDNARLRRAARRAGRLAGRSGLADALAATGAFRPDQLQLLRTGEATGTLELMLDRIRGDLQFETERGLKAFRDWFPRGVYACAFVFALWRMFG